MSREKKLRNRRWVVRIVITCLFVVLGVSLGKTVSEYLTLKSFTASINNVETPSVFEEKKDLFIAPIEFVDDDGMENYDFFANELEEAEHNYAYAYNNFTGTKNQWNMFNEYGYSGINDIINSFDDVTSDEKYIIEDMLEAEVIVDSLKGSELARNDVITFNSFISNIKADTEYINVYSQVLNEKALVFYMDTESSIKFAFTVKGALIMMILLIFMFIEGYFEYRIENAKKTQKKLANRMKYALGQIITLDHDVPALIGSRKGSRYVVTEVCREDRTYMLKPEGVESDLSVRVYEKEILPYER